MKRLILILVVIILTTRCTVQQYGTFTGNAVLSNNNYLIKGNVKGTSSSNQFLGIGGYNKKGLVEQAKSNIFAKYEINSNQALANVTVDIQKTNFFFIVYSTKVTITADLVEYNFTNPITKYPINSIEIQSNYISNQIYEKYSFNIGDNVSFEDDNSSKIISGKIIELKGNKALVEFINNKGIKKTHEIRFSELKRL